MVRRLREFHLTAVASNEYLRLNGAPGVPGELVDHNCVVDEVDSFTNRWPFRIKNKRVGINVSGNVKVNSGEIARNLAAAGVRVAWLPNFFVRDQIATGELMEILAGTVDSSIGLFCVYPKSKHVSAKVRVFIDFVIDHMGKA